jgi:predicted  nucleic acid-binding Zn-ribbon protein
MSTSNSPKVVAAVTTALLLASLFWLFSTKRINSSLETGLQDQKLKSEALLSEKLLLEKDIQKFKEQLQFIGSENSNLKSTISATERKLKAQQDEFNRLQKQNATLAQVRKQRNELQQLQKDLQEQLAALQEGYKKLQQENMSLQNTVASLQDKNNLLYNELAQAQFRSMDHAQVIAVRGKSEKLTVRARRIKKLQATFEVPSALKNMSFRITDPSGNILTPKDGTISSTITPSATNYTASNGTQAVGDKLQKVEMVYLPKEKLHAGNYIIEILNDNLYVGSLQVKLR